MRAQDFIIEAAPSDPATPSDYQQMLNFVRASRLEGVPPEQQIAVSLFKELQRQQTRNNNLEKELGAAEQRIDVAAQRTDMYGKQLKSHQAQLDQEQQTNKQQQAATDELDQQYSDRAQASQKQIEELAAKLNTIKSMPGIDQESAAALEQQISQLSRNSVSADKLAELEAHVSTVQNMQQVDDTAIKDLVAQVSAAQEASKELEKTKQTVGKDAEETTKRVLDQIEQIKQQLAHFQEVEQTVAKLQPKIDNVIAPEVERLTQAQAIANKIRISQTAKKFKDAIAKGEVQPNLGQDTIKMAQNALARPAAAPAQPAVTESQFFKAIKWATRK